MILSLVMSVTVYVVLQSFTGLLEASESMKDLCSGDYPITNETADIPVEAVERLRGDEAVEKLGTKKSKSSCRERIRHLRPISDSGAMRHCRLSASTRRG